VTCAEIAQNREQLLQNRLVGIAVFHVIINGFPIFLFVDVRESL
jgi:hypothetical protein